ncbi:hypothetical protein, partial [Klebsiella pneumoniae]|uniref:hypothetical protein n=1 Tax=Klebsiella pneumoniae TaxID=573 RepID=UPI001D0D9BDC
ISSCVSRDLTGSDIVINNLCSNKDEKLRRRRQRLTDAQINCATVHRLDVELTDYLTNEF